VPEEDSGLRLALRARLRLKSLLVHSGPQRGPRLRRAPRSWPKPSVRKSVSGKLGLPAGKLTSGANGGKLVHMLDGTVPLRNENEEGVDLTLIRWMLSLTPAERVEHIEQIAQSLQKIKELNRER